MSKSGGWKEKKTAEYLLHKEMVHGKGGNERTEKSSIHDKE